MAVILIAIGLLFTGIDIYGNFGFYYPEFHVVGHVGSHELSESIREYTVENILGSQVQVDYLPDAVGCIFILIGVCMLIKHNKQFIISIPFVFLTAAASILLRISGFLVQGPELVVWIFVLYFLLAFFELLTEYFVVYCVAGATDVLVNRASNTRMLFGWWITVFCRVFMVFLTFVGHFGVMKWYEAVQVVAAFFYLYHLIRARKYVGQSESLKIGMRRKRDRNRE